MTADCVIAYERDKATWKRCYVCDDHKDRCNFSRDRSRPDGLNRRCKACDRAMARAYKLERVEALRLLARFAGASCATT